MLQKCFDIDCNSIDKVVKNCKKKSSFLLYMKNYNILQDISLITLLIKNL